jgi:transcriptional antiterminator
MVDFKNYEARRAYLLYLIIHKYPLSRKQLAQKFNCEEHTITRMVNDLRFHKNYPIRYSKSLKRYVLVED